jgi:hypothetical protein
VSTFSRYRDAYFAPRRFSSDKWDSYFEVYDHVYGHLYGRDIVYFEIGVQNGGSLEIARSLFGARSRIIGMDIDEACGALVGAGLADAIYLGSQTDEALLDRILAENPPFDLVVDDASHQQYDMVATFVHLFPRLKEGAIYLIEDTATVHSDQHAVSFHGLDVYDYFKGLAGRLNLDYLRFGEIGRRFTVPHEQRPQRPMPDDICRHIFSISFFESVIAIEKRTKAEPLRHVR